MTRAALSLALLALGALPATAQEAAVANNFQGYMNYSFAHPFFLTAGSSAVWSKCPALYVVTLVAVAALFFRRGWNR